jgi:hypothetical protein
MTKHASEPLTDLGEILRHLAPVLTEEVFAFCSLEALPNDVGDSLLMTLQEPEGLSVIVQYREAVARGWRSSGPYRQIILTVPSSLEAVGMTAKVSSTLAHAGIPCNIVAGTRHDHVFVPEESAKRALKLLEEMSAAARLDSARTRN